MARDVLRCGRDVCWVYIGCAADRLLRIPYHARWSSGKQWDFRVIEEFCSVGWSESDNFERSFGFGSKVLMCT